MKLTLPTPFGYIGPSMLINYNPWMQHQFMGNEQRRSKEDEPIFTLSQIKYLLSSNGIEVDCNSTK